MDNEKKKIEENTSELSEKVNRLLNADDFSETDITEDGGKKDKIIINSSNGTACFYDWMHSIIIAIAVVIIILTFVFRIIDVDGTSMQDTLLNADKVVVSELFYTPQDGDIVVISHGAEYNKPIIKRVIATEGQTLDIDFNTGQVVVDGVVLQENYIKGKTIKGNAEIPSVVPEGKIFVMGDNRSASLDSRYTDIGLIDMGDIIGKAQFVVFPFTRFGYLY